jgi:glycosyltransferase A (GT-A) superfamily protein (DUF2064 family)
MLEGYYQQFDRVRNFFYRNFVPIPKVVQLAAISVYKKGEFVQLTSDSPFINKDCLQYVFTFLEPMDLVKIQTVNKNWYVHGSQFLTHQVSPS